MDAKLPNEQIDAQMIDKDSFIQLKELAVAADERFSSVHEMKDPKSLEVRDYFKMTGDSLQTCTDLRNAILQLPEECFMLKGATKDGKMILLNASAQRENHWQLTRFDAQGEPWGDTQYSSKSQAIKDFLSDIHLPTLDTPDGLFSESKPKQKLKI